MHSVTNNLSIREEGERMKIADSKVDLWIWLLLLAVLNLPILSGSWNDRFAFLPDAVMAGEWWRIFSSPFVHISFYHLCIDGIAFVLLYSSISEQSISKRATIFFGSALGGLLASVWASPEVQQVGLCGMSGVAHGLMAVCALEMASSKDKTARVLGWISFGTVLIKCAGEAISGRLIFDLVHFGDVGTPIVVCHAGGVIGALLTLAIWKLFQTAPDVAARGKSN